MSAMVVVGAVWLVLAFGLALVLGAGIRLADTKQAAEAAERNFAVDGDPFAAPRPAAPVLASAGGPGALLPLAHRPVDGA